MNSGEPAIISFTLEVKKKITEPQILRIFTHVVSTTLFVWIGWLVVWIWIANGMKYITLVIIKLRLIRALFSLIVLFMANPKYDVLDNWKLISMDVI